MVPEDYVHRIGRTGRAGTGGQAISLVCVDERPLLQEIQQLLRRAIPTETIAGFEPDRSIRPEPIRLRSTPAERAEIAARRAAAGGGGRGRGRPGAGRPSAGGAYGSNAPRHATPDRRGDNAYVAGPARSEGGYGGAPSRGGSAPRGSGPRRSGRGRPPGTPGTGFGNAAPQGRGPATERTGPVRPPRTGSSGGQRPPDRRPQPRPPVRAAPATARATAARPAVTRVRSRAAAVTARLGHSPGSGISRLG